MGWRLDFNSWLTRKLGWYGACIATSFSVAFLACGAVAVALQKSPRDILIPALMGTTTLIASGLFFGMAAKEPGRIRIRPALGGIATLGVCGPLTIFYSALHLGLIGAETFDGLSMVTLVSAPFIVLIMYFTIRVQLKGKKELV
jgi:hypothetical protein